MSDIRVLYVAGYGRSGSTILDIVLGQHPEATSLGAVHNLPFSSQQVCACGRDLERCEFWSTVINRVGTPDARDQLDVESRRRLFSLLTGRLDGDVVRRYRGDQLRLLEACNETAHTKWLVDSSKSANQTLGRPYALRQLLGVDVAVIHLARAPLSVLRSVSSGAGGSHRTARRRHPALQAAHTVIQWSVTNIACLVLFRGQNVVRLTLEGFLASPRSALERVGDLAGLDTTELADMIEQHRPFEPGHLLGGNRVKEQSAVVVRAGSPDPLRPSGVWEWCTVALTAPLWAIIKRASRGQSREARRFS